MSALALFLTSGTETDFKNLNNFKQNNHEQTTTLFITFNHIGRHDPVYDLLLPGSR